MLGFLPPLTKSKVISSSKKISSTAKDVNGTVSAKGKLG